MDENKAEQGVKSGGSPTSVTEKVDERGVPVKNVEAEYKRKYEALNSEYEDTKRRLAEIEARVTPQPNETELEEARKQELLELVNKGPKKFFAEMRQEEEHRRVAEDFKREEPKAIEWLKTKGLREDELPMIRKIIDEHGISAPTPMKRAEAAWKILRSEQLEKEFADRKSDSDRADAVTRTMPDGSSRSADAKIGPKRAELLAQLREASRKGDIYREVELTEQISRTHE